MEANKNIIKRRSFLKKFWKVIGVIALVETIYLIYTFLKPVQKPKQTAVDFFEAGTIDSFAPNSITPFRSRGFFLARLKSGEFIALSSKCTHLGCILECDTNRNLLLCPCHSSMFNIQGTVLRSPATRDLNKLALKIKQNKVLVNTGQIANKA